MTEKTLLISFLLAFSFGQSDFQKGVTHYNKRHEGCIEDKANPRQISMAITYFENVLMNETNKKDASLYLLKSYFFKAKFAEDDKALKKKILKKGKDFGLGLIEEFPNSVECRYWYLVNLGSWAEEYGIFAAAKEGVAEQMKHHSKKIIALNPKYKNGAGYFLLGAVHYKAPYIPFILSWPNNKDAIKYLRLAYDTGDVEIAQMVYLSEALHKGKRKDEAIGLLKKAMNLVPGKDNYASDWEWLKKARIIFHTYKK
jgi:tetratricopeptide (TPR) repeat protein|tara:strand:- start:794 stop:1561 length:768 start_codon:yes stop_codon:yes gene_type:complete